MGHQAHPYRINRISVKTSFSPSNEDRERETQVIAEDKGEMRVAFISGVGKHLHFKLTEDIPLYLNN
jgi:hypothetical protein